MVWGMLLPSGLGDFFPDGSFAGWSNALEAFYREKLPEAKQALFDDGNGNGPGNYVHFVSQKLISETGANAPPYSTRGAPLFDPIEDHEPPQSFTTVKGYKSLADLIMLNNRVLSVSKGLKAVIERLEPGKHRFFPIALLMPKCKVYPDQYFVLFIGQHCDSFAPEFSRTDIFRPDGPDHYWFEQKMDGVRGLALRKSSFGGAHLWRERRLGEWLTCLSDELQSAIANARLQIPKHYRMLEI